MPPESASAKRRITAEATRGLAALAHSSIAGTGRPMPPRISGRAAVARAQHRNRRPADRIGRTTLDVVDPRAVPSAPIPSIDLPEPRAAR